MSQHVGDAPIAKAGLCAVAEHPDVHPLLEAPPVVHQVEPAWI